RTRGRPGRRGSAGGPAEIHDEWTDPHAGCYGANMRRVAIAILWIVLVGSADAAFMKGTLTLDDGRTATLTLRHFVRGGSPNIPSTSAGFRCSGDACFTPSGNIGFELPFRGGYSLGFDESASVSFPPYCATLTVQKRPGSCRIASRIVCDVEDPNMNPI